MARSTTRRQKLLGPLALLAGLALAGCTPTTPDATAPSTSSTPAAASTGGADQLVPVALTVPDGVDAGAASGRSLNLPAGWTAEVYANVPGARMAVWTPDGRLIVSTGTNGRLALITPGAAGAAGTVTTLLDGLNDPQGVAVTTQDGRTVLVVGEDTRLTAWDYADGQATNPQVILDGLPGGGHNAKMVAVRDGQVYYSLGSSGNRVPADRTATPQRAVIGQVGLDGSGNHDIAVGVRNGEGLSFAPDGTLYTAVNQMDNQPYPFQDSTGQYGQSVRDYVNEHPNDQIAPVTPGLDLGWPYCVPDSTGHDDLTNLGYVNDPEFNPDGQQLDCASIGTTQLGLPAHSAPIGFNFTHGSTLPASLADGALITAHGSWNRQPPREPYVAYSAWDATTSALTPIQVIVAGFQDADGSRWGRSVDTVAGPDGALYVTDDTAGLVYRIVPEG